MTATAAGLRQVTSNGPSARLACAAAVAALAIARGVLAQASGPVDIYADDSQTRRSPAATAFPDYPAEERRDRVEGETTVCFRINAAGEIVRPKVRNSTHRAFEKPAMAAIRESLFVPLAAGEGESPADVCRVYRFRLKPIAAANAVLPEDTALAAAVAGVATVSPDVAALAPIESGYPATTATDAHLAAESAPAENEATSGDAAGGGTAEVMVVTGYPRGQRSHLQDAEASGFADCGHDLLFGRRAGRARECKAKNHQRVRHRAAVARASDQRGENG